MLSISRLLLVALCLAALTATAVAADKRDANYLTKDGKLTARLILKDSQSGFAGVTGSIWTIEPDGSWKRQTFINRTVRKADKKGKLTKSQLKQLAAVLKANSLLTLPTRLGGKPMVNPKSIALSFGKKESNYLLRGGGKFPKVDPKKSNRTADERFAAIVHTMTKLLKPKSAD